MAEEKEIVGYYTEDGNIYCVECINKNIDMLKKIDEAITADDLEEDKYICNGCKEKFK